ncbi:uncharacterized protein LOC106637924 [Copidosoma floridanum]|uniref:uncharacterized protein LOC106637924 n=1 Tax=Copidosoma floridanum TaxID=29053 RepID=UPI0006C9A218|nr:uncharacterized protein LOC106637924 [Copidosoma floridanum]
MVIKISDTSESETRLQNTNGLAFGKPKPVQTVTDRLLKASQGTRHAIYTCVLRARGSGHIVITLSWPLTRGVEVPNTIVRGTIGNVSEFVADDDWGLWYEQFEQYCEINEVPVAKRVPLFVTLLGKEAYGLLRNLCSPALPKALPLGELARVMKEHLQPTPCVLVECYKFKEYRQRLEENLKSFVAGLKKLSTHCDFGQQLEDNLRDQLVWGLSSDTIKRRLLGERSLTFVRACDIAASMEAACRDAAVMQSGSGSDALNYVRDKGGRSMSVRNDEPSGAVVCFCCGRVGHCKPECRFREYKCKKCGKVGHLQVVCRRKDRDEFKCMDVGVFQRETAHDVILRQVRQYLIQGWPKKVVGGLEPYKHRHLELTSENGCIFWGHRVVVPAALRGEVLRELHSIHWGIIQYNDPPRATLHVWKWPDVRTQRIHVDFCGPIDGCMYIVIIDAYSKWVDVRELSYVTAATTIRVLKEYFAVWGLPEVVVSDNGPTLTSDEFHSFLRNNNVEHIRSAPYHPASNGAAENAVKTFKEKFKLLVKTMPRHDALCKYLFHYCATPHCTTGCSPAQLQLGRELRTRLGAIDASVRVKVKRGQDRQRQYCKGSHDRQFNKGQIVMAKDIVANQWQKAEIINRNGQVTYDVKLSNNRVWKRHIDQLRTCQET